MEYQKAKIKVISETSVPISDTALSFTVSLFLADYGDTPYKLGRHDDGLVNDFWFKHLIDGTQVDTFSIIAGIDIEFWVAFKPGEGLYATISKDNDVSDDLKLFHKQIVEEGELLLTDPEFRIHARLQEKYFKNEKEMEWD
jgi:hypothetical protein